MHWLEKKVRLSLIWLYLYVCIRSHACPSIGRSVGLSVYCANVKTAQNCRSWLQSFFLSPSHFRSLALTFSHLHSLSLKCSFIKNVHSYILNQPGTHIHLFFSVENKLVIQGSHMVSGTRYPAWSDQLKKWRESRAAAPKDWCPVGHRGEFPDILRGLIWGLSSIFPCYLMGILLFFFQFLVNFTLFSFFINFPCYSMRIMHFYTFLSFFHVI